jgi:hypothetical protein
MSIISVEEAIDALRSVAGEPLGRGSLTDSRSLPCLRQRLPLLHNAVDEEPAAVRAGPGVTRGASSGDLLGSGGFDTPASKEARMNNVLRNYT